MKKVLIYGDSNVWGDDFVTNKRIPDDKQWTNILQKSLKEKYHIIQEGLPGRLAGDGEQEKPFKNGKLSFLAIYRSHAPLDMVVIALGTNDLQNRYQKTVVQIQKDLIWYQEIIESEFKNPENLHRFFKDGKMPKIIYLLPPNFNYSNTNGIFDEESETKRQQLIMNFKSNDGNLTCLICNNIDLLKDGLHFSYDGHQTMASLVERVILENEK